MKLLTENYITRGFWGDEAWTALISQRSIPEMLRVTGEDFHPPMYYLLVHFWGSMFGFSELAIRSLSFIFFAATPLMTYFLSGFLFKEKSSRLLTSALVTISPILFTYAFESRAYAILTFLSVATSFLFWKSRTAKTWKLPLAYMLLSAFTVYVHYYAWFILAAHGVYALLFEWKTIKKIWWVGVGVILIQLPWVPVLFSQVNSVSNSYWIGAMNARTHLEFFYRVAAGDIGITLQITTGRVIALIVAVSLVARFWQRKTTPFYRFLLLWLVVPTLIPTLISFFVPVFFYRYLIFSSVPLLLLTVDGLRTLPKFVGVGATLVVIALYLSLTWTRFVQYPHTMRQELATIYETKQPGEGEIYTVLPSFAEVMYYAGPTEKIIVTPEGLIQFSGKSLLDSFVRTGEVTIAEPPTDAEYWYLEPGPKSRLVTPATDSK
ncbi:MAG TPA: glycosyltransferase family 39 protein [Patescibacteria group bacterium]